MLCVLLIRSLKSQSRPTLHHTRGFSLRGFTWQELHGKPLPICGGDGIYIHIDLLSMCVVAKTCLTSF